MDPYWDADVFRPLFTMDLTVKDHKVQFEPSLETMRETVLTLFDDITSTVEGIDDIRGRVRTKPPPTHPLRTSFPPPTHPLRTSFPRFGPPLE
eukprot:1181178-Prorocentrum_minimum.AAC.1